MAKKDLNAVSANVTAQDSIKNDLFVKFLTAEIQESERKKSVTMEKLDNPDVREVVQNIESNYIVGLYKALMLYLDVQYGVIDSVPDEQVAA